MLAYVFWHWPRPGISSDVYEQRQIHFHRELAERGPAALESSSIWRVMGSPWTPASIAYEDWYLLESSAGLDALNAAAVSDAMRESHDAAASLAAGGFAALYTPSAPRVGLEPMLTGGLEQWFAKPDGMRYATLYARLGAQAASVWTRMMTLGPTPEFVLLGDDAHALPMEWRAQTVRRERIWPLDAVPDDTSARNHQGG